MIMDHQVIHLVFRHGARGPSLGALKPFTGTAVYSEWDIDNDPENLTQVGEEMCLTLGRHFGRQLAGTEKVVKWHSSKVDRAIESGYAFVRGLHEAGVVHDSQMRATPIDQQDPDFYFRGYKWNKKFREAENNLRSGVKFEAYAENKREELSRIKPDLENCELKEKLNYMTYYEEVYECERFWPSGNKYALSQSNTAEVQETASRFARWCWNERFFVLEESKVLGQPLLQYIHRNQKKDGENGPDFVFYSAHDYTIISLLNAIGFGSYPDSTLGFCSYILFQGDQIFLNPVPFPDAQSLSTVSLEKIIRIR